MPLIQVTLREGRPGPDIRAMIGAVTRAVAEALNTSPQSVRIIVSEVPATHWATGDVTLQEKLEHAVNGHHPAED